MTHPALEITPGLDEDGIASYDARAISSLHWFARMAWHVIDSRPLVWNWHLDILCDLLMGVTAGTVPQREIVICIPPRFTKTRLVSVFWPAWRWLQDPGHAWLCTSGVDDVAKKSSLEHRRIVMSEWYQGLVQQTGETGRDGEPWSLTKDQSEKVHFQNTAGGSRESLTTGARVTGRGGDTIIVDDPYDVREVIFGSPARVGERMTEGVNYYRQVLSSRMNDKRLGYRVTIMQRLHLADLAGVLRKEPDVLYVWFPMEYDPEHAHEWDPRTERGELLCEARMGDAEVAKMKRELGSRHYAAQGNQDPKQPEGGTFNAAKWLRYPLHPRDQADRCDVIAISLDCTFKKAAGSDRVSFTVWGKAGAYKYLLDRVTDHMGYTQTRATLRDLAARWPRAYLKLIEDKANGPAVMDDLRGIVEGMVPFEPGQYGSKEARAEVASVAFEAGDVFLPEPEHCPWVLDYIEELKGYPGTRYDDDVDSTSQILLYWGTSPIGIAVYDERQMTEGSSATRGADGEEDDGEEDPFAEFGVPISDGGDPPSSVLV